MANAFDFPGFVPAFIRPLFCEGKGPFRVGRALRRTRGHRAHRPRAGRAVPDDEALQRWLRLAAEKVPFQGLPARICWLGYGDRARAGLAINDLVAAGEVAAPIVIGRDHLDAGIVASPNRETEAMRDGSDAIADWPILNALVTRRPGRRGSASTTAAASASATRSMPAWSSWPTARRRQPPGSSEC